MLPADRRAAVIGMLAGWAARTVAGHGDGGRDGVDVAAVAGCEDKIGPEHRDRAAIVYVRQSSRQQVLEHGESTRLQYALAERAVALGWARSRVTVIDDDPGVSAAVSAARVGFQK